MNNKSNKIMNFFWTIYICIKYISSYVKDTYIYLLFYNLYYFEHAAVALYRELIGEWYAEEFSYRWNFAIYFYSTLWNMIIKKIEDKFELLKLEWVWKIKRSNNFIVKKIAKFLSKYNWFNNNIINF